MPHDVHTDARLRRQIAGLAVKCHLNPDKCMAIGILGKHGAEFWRAHHKTCNERPAPCPGCKEKIPLSSLANHINTCGMPPFV